MAARKDFTNSSLIWNTSSETSYQVQYCLLLSHLTAPVSISELVEPLNLLRHCWVTDFTTQSEICPIQFPHKLCRIRSSFDDTTLFPTYLKVGMPIKLLLSSIQTSIRNEPNYFLNFLLFFNHRHVFCFSDHFIMFLEKTQEERLYTIFEIIFYKAKVCKLQNGIYH